MQVDAGTMHSTSLLHAFDASHSTSHEEINSNIDLATIASTSDLSTEPESSSSTSLSSHSDSSIDASSQLPSDSDSSPPPASSSPPTLPACSLTLNPSSPSSIPSSPPTSTTSFAPSPAISTPPTFILNKFTLFPHLPPELRLKIWTHALPPPTIHTISLPTCACTLPYVSDTCPPLSGQSSIRSCPRQHVPRTLSSLPILLRVCHEARTQCLHYYTVLYSPIVKGFHLAVDRKHDGIYFTNGRGPAGGDKFWSVRGELPACVQIAPYSLPLSPRSSRIATLISTVRDQEQSPTPTARLIPKFDPGRRLKNVVIDEATLSREDYLLFPTEILSLTSITILLMPWSSPLSSPSITSPYSSDLTRAYSTTPTPSSSNNGIETWELSPPSCSGGDARLMSNHSRAWGDKALHAEFLVWLDEMRGVESEGEVRETGPSVRVALWGACLQDCGGFSDGGGTWRVAETGLWVVWEWVGR